MLTNLQHEADILEANRIFKDCRLRLDAAESLRARMLAAKALLTHLNRILQPVEETPSEEKEART